MYIIFIVILLVSYISTLSQCLYQSNPFISIYVLFSTAQIVSLIAICAKGHVLSNKRERFKKFHTKHYYPDGYLFVFLFWYIISNCVLSVIDRIIYNLQFSTYELVLDMIGFVIGSFAVCIPLSIYFKKQCTKVSIFDPVSKQYRPEEEKTDESDNLIPLYKNIWTPNADDNNIIKMIVNPVGETTKFAVVVQDDSMSPSGIQRGSIVYFSDSARLDRGDTVAVLVGNQIVVRRVAYFEDNAFSLESSNDAFPPMTFENTQQANIMGVATAIYKDIQ